MGLPGSHTSSLAALPWGLERHHLVADFTKAEGQERARQIVEFALSNGFTQLLGPSHLLSGANDPWLRRDIETMASSAKHIEAAGNAIDLIYSLAVPIDVLRNRSERQALVAAIADAPCDAIWLKIENFGDDATGEKTAAYIEMCQDFHDRGVPLVSDYAGGLPGIAGLAFGAVGGIAHGVTMNQNFKASSWRRPPTRSGGGQTWRVYFQQLDMLMKPPVANPFLILQVA